MNENTVLPIQAHAVKVNATLCLGLWIWLFILLTRRAVKLCPCSGLHRAWFWSPPGNPNVLLKFFGVGVYFNISKGLHPLYMKSRFISGSWVIGSLRIQYAVRASTEIGPPFLSIPQAHDLPRPLSISFHRLHSLTTRLWLTYMPWRLPFDVPEIAWQFYKFSSCLIIQQLKWNSHNSPRHCVLFGATLQGPLYPYPWPIPPSEPTFPFRNLEMLNVLSSEHGHHSYTISP